MSAHLLKPFPASSCFQVPSKFLTQVLPLFQALPAPFSPFPAKITAIAYKHSLYAKHHSKHLIVWTCLFHTTTRGYRSEHHPNLTGQSAQAQRQGHWPRDTQLVGGEASPEPRKPGFTCPIDIMWFQTPVPVQLLCQVHEGRWAGIPGGWSFKTQLRTPVLDHVCPIPAPIAPWVPLPLSLSPHSLAHPHAIHQLSAICQHN